MNHRDIRDCHGKEKNTKGFGKDLYKDVIFIKMWIDEFNLDHGSKKNINTLLFKK